MKNLYNKGPYRGYEYAKHLRPYGKKLGNKKWRSTFQHTVKEDLTLEKNIVTTLFKPFLKKKVKKEIKVKITHKGFNGIVFSCYKRYKSYRELQDSIKRNNIIRVLFETKK